MKAKYDRVALHRIKQLAQKLRRGETDAEYHLRAKLRRHGERLILRQHIVGRVIVDLALPYRNLLVEVDGSSHREKAERDGRRDLWLRNLGFRVLRVSNGDVFERLGEVLGRVDEFPESGKNRELFYFAVRCAKAKSYWVLPDSPFFESKGVVFGV